VKVTSPTSSNLNKICFLDSLNGWIVGDNNVVLSTTNGGNTWVENQDNSLYLANYYGAACGEFGGSAGCWVSGGQPASNLSVIRLSGHGQWGAQIIGSAGYLYHIFFLDDSLGWTAGNPGLILSTKNGGLWWTQQPSPYSTSLGDIRFFNPQVGLCVGDSGLIMKSRDGGSNWRVIQSHSPSGGTLFRLFLTSDSIAYIVGDTTSSNGSVILESTDRGETWTKQSISVSSGTWLEDVYFVNDSVGWTVGANGLILHTVDGGAGKLLLTPALLEPTTGDTLAVEDTALVWNAVPTATSYEVQIALDSSFSNLVVDSKSIKDTTLTLKGLYNTVLNADTKYFWHVKAMNSGGVSIFSNIWSFIVGTITSINDPQMPKVFNLSQNYPNPFNPTTVISYSLPRNSYVTLTIYNDLGQKVETLVDEEQNPGGHSISFDASKLSSGIYFYRLQAGTYTQSKKLVLLK
jgi:photosystem II stability/assembly factor-like uncharacterized protein